MSPILDSKGNAYPGYTRRRLEASHWWKSRWMILMMAVVIGVQIAAAVALSRERRGLSAEAPKVVHISPLTSILTEPYLDTPLLPATQQQQASLARAIAAWKKVLPDDFDFPIPELYQGSAARCEDLRAIACANPLLGMIVISQVRACDCDLDTVLMHEVGHLLGVPHIEGDELMDAEYKASVNLPTRPAIALALLNNRLRVRPPKETKEK
jgi:hypothetical protein